MSLHALLPPPSPPSLGRRNRVEGMLNFYSDQIVKSFFADKACLTRLDRQEIR